MMIQAVAALAQPYQGTVKVYIVEPYSRWQDANLDHYSFGFLSFAATTNVTLEDKDMFSQTVVWDASDAGFSGVVSTNIMAQAVVYDSVPVLQDAAPPYGAWYNAHFGHATATALPGVPGQQVTAPGFTHTVFIEEGTSSG